MAQRIKRLPEMQETQVQSLAREDTLEEDIATNGNPLQYSCLENPMDGGAWQATVHGVTKGQTRLSDFTFTHWRRKWQPTPVFVPGESQGRGKHDGLPSMGSQRVGHD